jgi:hypothetical protein
VAALRILFPMSLRKGAPVVTEQARTPSRVIGDLLAGHPEARSLLAEAGHRAALARSSAADTRRTFAAAQDTRTGYEELRRRLDPRGLRTVNFSVGLVVLVLLGAGLTVLADIQVSGLLSHAGSVLIALAAATVWLTGGWLAALASRESRRPTVIALAGTAALLGLLLAVVHALGRPGTVVGILASVLELAVAVGAAALMTRLESAPVFAARSRWHRAQRAHKAAVRLEQGDIEAMHVATESWLGLVRTWAATAADDDEDLADRTVTLAVALLEGSQPRRDRVERLLPGEPR